MKLINELKRRNVIRVAAAYLIIGWLLAQVSTTLEAALILPPWFDTLIVTVMLIGFPIALIISWVYELTPEGIKKEKDTKADESINHEASKKLNYITLVAAIAVAGMFIWQHINPSSDSRLRGNDNRVMRSDSGLVEGNGDSNNQAVIPAQAGIYSIDSEINKNSIAVLPFVNMSSDNEKEYFSDGLTDTILHKLVQLPELRVAARTSSFKFKGLNEDMREIAVQLGVANVLEGSVQRQGNRVRITAQLINGSDGSHLWSKIFDETLDDIFRVQDEIANGVAAAMLKTLKADSNSSGEIGGTKNLQAYEAYLKGMDAIRKGTPEGVNISISQLELAVNLDPDYALAWAGLSKAYEGPAELGTATWESTYAPMTRAAEMAIEKAPKLAAAHLAYAYVIDRKGEGSSNKSIEKAIELEPYNVEALAALAELKIHESEYREALILAEKAISLNPLDNTLQVLLAEFKINLGDVDSAINNIGSLILTNTEDLQLKKDYSRLLMAAGRDLEAMRVTKQILENNSNLLEALFRASNLHMHYRDAELADKYLSRVETISPNRAMDDRAYYCLNTGDMQCYDAYINQYIRFLRQSGSDKYADIEEAIQLIFRGEPIKSIQLLESLSHESIYWLHDRFSEHNNFYLAVAFDKNGQKIERDEILNIIEKDIQKSLSNGLSPRIVEPNLIRIAAIKGDAQLAAQRLSLSIKNKYPPRLNELTHYPFYDTVRDHPEFKKQMENLEAYEDEIKNEMITEGIW